MTTLPIPSIRLLLPALLIALLAPGGTADEPPPIRFLLEWGTKGTGPGQFHFPIGIALNPAGEVLVTDFYNDRLQRFSAAGKLLAVMPVLPNPGGMAIGRSGEVYIAHFAERKREERTTDRISVYDPSGKLLRQWGRTGSGDGEFDCPGGIALGRDGRVYVADQTNRRVQVFDSEGKFLASGASMGSSRASSAGMSRSGPGWAARSSWRWIPTETSSRPRDRCAACKSSRPRDGSCSPGARIRRSLADSAVAGWAGSSKVRSASCVDDGTLWVTSVNGRVQQFSPQGKFLRGLLNEPGVEPGQFMAPHGVAVDPQRNLYVVDAYNHRIQKFATR